MAIDKQKAKVLVTSTEDLFDTLTSALPGVAKAYIRKMVMGPAFEEIGRLITNSRPPILMLIGRSGHGKSSVINALANKPVAAVNEVKPCTPFSERYDISFAERYAAWTVIDTRGIFESTTPHGGLAGDAVTLLKHDLLEYRPDVIMHVISIPEVRALSNDLRVFKELTEGLQNQTGAKIPTVVVLNKADTLGRPGAWPPEEHPNKAALIGEALEYMTTEVLKVASATDLTSTGRMHGVATVDDVYKAVIPLCAYRDEEEDLYWNIETLSDYIGLRLPREAQLDFFQAQKRKEQLKRLSTSLIKRFATISSGVGASPIPIADMAILTPLQLIMIAIIGGLSCREFSQETAGEFFSAAGLNVATGFGLRFLAQQLVKMIPLFGWVGSGAVAGAGTYAIGKSAEAYFFSGELKKPEEFERDWHAPEA